jgi:hypothetical protein
VEQAFHPTRRNLLQLSARSCTWHNHEPLRPTQTACLGSPTTTATTSADKRKAKSYPAWAAMTAMNFLAAFNIRLRANVVKGNILFAPPGQWLLQLPIPVCKPLSSFLIPVHCLGLGRPSAPNLTCLPVISTTDTPFSRCPSSFVIHQHGHY